MVMRICYIFSNYYLHNIIGQPAIILKLAKYAAKEGKEIGIEDLVKGIPYEQLEF